MRFIVTPFMVLSVLALSGCGWVDATGVQAGEQMVGAPPTALPVALADGGIVEINENSTQRVFIPRSTAAWTWLPRLNTDSIEQCRLVDGFDTSLAQQELNLACTDAKNCELIIEPTGTGIGSEFDVSLPALKAPVALSFTLETRLESGQLVTQQQTVCGISVNEAPDIKNDFYLALIDEERIVPANFPFGVLANDTDDVDVRNEGLRLSGIASEPVYADEFILLADGSFRYTAKDNLELGDAAFLDDVITVRISDGIHQVDSTITVRLVEENRAPTLQSRIPNFIALIADDQTIDVAIDFSSYFADKDGNTLRYSITDVPAITSGNLVFSENGQLRGTLSTNDFGSDLITLTAFDGLETASDRFRLTVRSDRSAEGSFFSSAELTVKLHE